MKGERAREPLRFELFGPVRAWRGDQQLDLGSPRRCAVAAVLLLHANQRVGRDNLIQAVWGEPAPAFAVNQLQKYVSGLRRVLDPGRNPRARSETLQWSEGGYALSVVPGGLDLKTFKELVARGRTARADGDPEQASTHLQDALSLWRGPALANVSGLYLDGERDRLTEWRVSVVEERIEADLELGRHADLVTELAGLVAEFPLRERLRARLMLALYRCGRQAEALAVFDETRRILRDGLGVDPGPDVQKLHARILRSDPSLSQHAWPVPQPRRADPPQASAHEPEAVRGLRQLPMDITEFVGREAELEQLQKVLGRAGAPSDAGDQAVSVAVIEGMAGVGKTRLAVHAGHRFVAAGLFGDMQLWADLKGFSPSGPPADPADVLEDFLRLLGVPGSQIPAGAEARAALYRDRLAGKRALVVLDDAVDEDQVRLLLPGNSSCALLITSRRVLSGLDGAHTLRLGTFSQEEALSLVMWLSGRPDDDPGSDAARRLVELSGRLPLAVALAGRRLRTRPTWKVDELARRLDADEGRLRQFTIGTRTVDAAFELSYRALPAELQRAFRLLTLHPGDDFTPPSAAALLNVDCAEADGQLELLLDEHLLQQHTFGRYRYHDLLRLYAGGRARSEDDELERRTAVRRLVDWYCGTAEAARQALEPWRPHPGGGRRADSGAVSGAGEHAAPPHADSALEWLERERANLLAVSREAAAADWHHDTWRLATEAHAYLVQHTYGTDSHEGLRLGLGAARRMSDPVKQAQIMRDLGGMYDGLGRHEDSAAQHRAALALSEEAGDVHGAAEALTGLGRTSYALGNYPQSAEQHRQALALFKKTADLHGQARSRGGLGLAHWFTPGRYRESAKEHRCATTLFEVTGDSRGHAHEACNMGLAHWIFGNYKQCARYHGRALALFRQSGDVRGQAIARHGLGLAAWHLGRPDTAQDHHLYALGVFRELSDRRGEAIALHRLGYVKWVTGEYRQGEELLHQALALGSSISNRQTEAWTLTSLGFLCQRLQRTEEGHEHLQKALRGAQAIGDPHCEASALLGLALNSLYTGQPDSCRKAAHRALLCARSLSNPHGESMAMITLGFASSARRRPREAAKWHREALSLARRTAEPFTESMALTGLGRACTENGHYEQAERHLVMALAIRERITDRHGQADTLVALADLMDATDRPETAQSSRGHAQALLTEIGAPPQRNQAR
ncbi:BTAD domain-containing putative transcriptional regulator [Streptomyces sp. DSM 41527]|uniref:BTAD domain-containing putative transcriptional regulator n=1 Tax=Streptomyces mooreae TaxID=3075523 RepID=A0ABU2TD47_9ACTN|nr:BTAD domain-containing putative transcriptional regulator [Streptomyces sp. DSM 41527]MDT0458873.1 BTAD domain-containing putative transcriptional regulator [Streptomyces sp. DSM 41527]